LREERTSLQKVQHRLLLQLPENSLDEKEEKKYHGYVPVLLMSNNSIKQTKV
jgi:hypothetical protein